MATIRKNGSNWQAIVRKKGFKNQSKSFPLKRDAQAWANVTESEMVITGTSSTILSDSLGLLESSSQFTNIRDKIINVMFKILKSSITASR